MFLIIAKPINYVQLIFCSQTGLIWQLKRMVFVMNSISSRWFIGFFYLIDNPTHPNFLVLWHLFIILNNYIYFILIRFSQIISNDCSDFMLNYVNKISKISLINSVFILNKNYQDNIVKLLKNCMHINRCMYKYEYDPPLT